MTTVTPRNPKLLGHVDMFNETCEFFATLGFRPREIFRGMSNKEIGHWRKGTPFPIEVHNKEHVLLVNAIRVGLLNLMTKDQALDWFRKPPGKLYDAEAIGLPAYVFDGRAPSRIEIMLNASCYYQSAMLLFEEVQSMGFDYNNWIITQMMNNRSIADSH